MSDREELDIVGIIERIAREGCRVTFRMTAPGDDGRLVVDVWIWGNVSRTVDLGSKSFAVGRDLANDVAVWLSARRRLSALPADVGCCADQRMKTPGRQTPTGGDRRENQSSSTSFSSASRTNS